jgi:DNA polymerase-3 subunit delta
MKWPLRQLESQLNQAVELLPPLLLIYGDDGGAVRQAAQNIIARTGVEMEDPFAADRLDGTDLAAEPQKLMESAGTVSLMGGLRVVRVEGISGDVSAATLGGVAAAVKACLEVPLQDVVIVIPAPGLGKDHALVKAVEKDKKAVAVRCFQDNVRDLGTFVRSFMQEQGKTLQPAAQALLVENLGADRDVTRREVEKLALYVGEQKEITREDVLACLADAPAANVFKLCDAVGAREAATVDRLLTLLLDEGEDANQLFNMVVWHLRRILQVREAMEQGQTPTAALKTLQPPVMFGQDAFLSQVQRTPLPRLRLVVQRALELQFQTRDLALPPEVHLRRGMLALSV